MTGFCEHDNKFLGSIKGEEFLHQMSDYQLVNKRWLHTIRKLVS